MEIPRYWRNNKQRYLVGDIDSQGNVSFPPGPRRPRFDPNTGKAVENDKSNKEEMETIKNYLVFQSTVTQDIK